MTNRHNTFAILAIATFALSAVSAEAVVSIDFNVGGSATHAGEPDNNFGLQLPGVTTWNGFNIAASAGAQSIATAEGPTFTLNPGGGGPGFNVYNQISLPTYSNLRGDILAMNTGAGHAAAVPWELTGLAANQTYDLVFFQRTNYSGAYTTIDGVGAGAYELTEKDYDFTGVAADGTGKISGTFNTNAAGQWFSFSGLQFEVNGGPPPSPPPANPVVSIDVGPHLHSGEPSHVDGLQLPGQTGPWYQIDFGNSPDTRSITTPEGTFNFNTTNQVFSAWPNGGDTSNSLRRDYWYLNSGSTAIEILWTLTDLTPGASYDLVLFSQYDPNFGGYSRTAFAIDGHDAGNGIGLPVTVDSDGDGNFIGVVADANGMIQGSMALDGWSFAVLEGIQFQRQLAADDAPVTPEPATAALALMGLGGMAMLRRRKDA